MASPHRLSDAEHSDDEPELVDDGFEIVEDDAVETATNAEISDVSDSGSAVPWILMGILVTGVTATVLLVGMPMNDEIQLLRSEKHRLADDLKAANARVDELTAEIDSLDATRARLTATVAQKTVALEDADRAQQDLAKKLHDEVKKAETKPPEPTPAASHRSRRSRKH